MFFSTWTLWSLWGALLPPGVRDVPASLSSLHYQPLTAVCTFNMSIRQMFTLLLDCCISSRSLRICFSHLKLSLTHTRVHTHRHTHTQCIQSNSSFHCSLSVWSRGVQEAAQSLSTTSQKQKNNRTNVCFFYGRWQPAFRCMSATHCDKEGMERNAKDFRVSVSFTQYYLCVIDTLQYFFIFKHHDWSTLLHRDADFL